MTNRTMKIAALGLAASTLLVGAAFAENGRFLMEKTEQGYVRMDTQTGAMSICETSNGQIVCKMAADERAAFDADIKALEERVAALEKQMSGGMALSQRGNDGLPSEEEFERGLGYMEKFMRRFMGLAKELDEPENRT